RSLEGAERGEQREREQPGSAEQESEHKTPEAKSTTVPGRLDDRRWRHRYRLLALDDAARDVVGHRVNRGRNLEGLRQDDASVAGVLDKPVSALVTPHHDMGDDIDPEPRRVALADAAIENIDVIGDLCEQRIQRLVEDLEPRDLGIPKVDNNAGAVGSVDPGLPQRVAQPTPAALAVACRRGRIAIPGSHCKSSGSTGINLPIT